METSIYEYGARERQLKVSWVCYGRMYARDRRREARFYTQFLYQMVLRLCRALSQYRYSYTVAITTVKRANSSTEIVAEAQRDKRRVLVDSTLAA